MEDETSFSDPEAPPHSHSSHSEWMGPIEDRLSVLQERALKTSIFKVPNKLRKVDEEAYSPRIVSIGPFHSTTTTISILAQTSKNEDHPQKWINGEDHLPAKEENKWNHMLSLLQQIAVKKQDHLRAMEEHKWWYIIYFLNRTKDKNLDTKSNPNQKPGPKEILVLCGDALLKLDKKVRGRYAENITFDSHELAQIMLVDGCFILELFLRSSLRDSTEGDPIFHNAWMVPTIRRDLALLENQIPFFILKELFNIVVRHFPEYLPYSVTDLALSFFHPGLNLNQEAIRNRCSQPDNILHLLDLLHNFYLPTSLETDTKVKEPSRFRKCATKFLEAGLEFKKGKEEEDHLLDISFSEAKGDIIIPPLRIDDRTKSLLRNLIAYEQCCGRAQQHITSYAILLQSLIHSLRDVELLQKNQIIKNDLSEVEDVLTFFRSISGGVVPKDLNDSYYGKLCDEVNEYQQSCWHWHRLTAFLMVRCRRYYVELKNKYLSSPWTFLSFIAAFVLLVLTIVQTIFSVISYKHPH